MKDQDPNQERQVATQDPTQSREQAQAEQQYQHDQQPRPEFQSVEQRQPSQPVEPQSRQQANGGLIGGQEMDCYAARWVAIQAAFVDEPKKAVEQADKLVEEVIQNLSKTFANERQKLEGQWSRGDSASTEDLRVALQRYRQFFQSLLRS
jgi:hypothetical protein